MEEKMYGKFTTTVKRYPFAFTKGLVCQSKAESDIFFSRQKSKGFYITMNIFTNGQIQSLFCIKHNQGESEFQYVFQKQCGC